MNPQMIDWLVHGGNVGVLGAVVYLLLKVNTKLVREESIKEDYPPHKHVNGFIVYPKDYQPTSNERLNGD